MPTNKHDFSDLTIVRFHDPVDREGGYSSPWYLPIEFSSELPPEWVNLFKTSYSDLSGRNKKEVWFFPNYSGSGPPRWSSREKTPKNRMLFLALAEKKGKLELDPDETRSWIIQSVESANREYKKLLAQEVAEQKRREQTEKQVDEKRRRERQEWVGKLRRPS